MWAPGWALGEERFPSYSVVVQKDTGKKKMIKRNDEVERTEAEGVQRTGLMFSSLRFYSIIYWYSTPAIRNRAGKNKSINFTSSKATPGLIT